MNGTRKVEISDEVLNLLHADPVKIKSLSEADYTRLRDLLARTCNIGVEALDALRSAK
jgi:hypothetical protein